MRRGPGHPQSRMRVSHVQGVVCAIVQWRLVGRLAHARFGVHDTGCALLSTVRRTLR